MNNQTPTAPLNYLNHKTGLWSWLSSTDHKRIGLLYFYCIVTFFLSAAVLGLLMKIEKVAPGETIMTAQTYNAMFTLLDFIAGYCLYRYHLFAVGKGKPQGKGAVRA